MGEYIVTKGQNLYDIALHIYGSIEGITDLLANNPELSLGDSLPAGNKVIYSNDYLINENIVAYTKMFNLTPANGERHVYFKTPSYPFLAVIFIDNGLRYVEFSVSGSGTLEIDWGDNSELQMIPLQDEMQTFLHYFDNTTPDIRKIKVYGEATIRIIDVSKIQASEIRLLKPLSVEQFRLSNGDLSLTFLPLLQYTYRITLPLLKCNSLIPLAALSGLIEVDLSKGRFLREVLDDYLIRLVTHHGNRRSCTIKLSGSPSGEYREPLKDDNNRYILSCGMEAVWVLTHEPAWNEGGFWKVIINDQLYTAEK